jgi:hypothetical protein
MKTEDLPVMKVKHMEDCKVHDVVEFYSLQPGSKVSVVKALFCKSCLSGVSGHPNSPVDEFVSV